MSTDQSSAITDIKTYLFEEDISEIERCVAITSKEVGLPEPIIFRFIRDVICSDPALMFLKKFIGIELVTQQDIIELLRNLIRAYRNNGRK